MASAFEWWLQHWAVTIFLPIVAVGSLYVTGEGPGVHLKRWLRGLVRWTTRQHAVWFPVPCGDDIHLLHLSAWWGRLTVRCYCDKHAGDDLREVLVAFGGHEPLTCAQWAERLVNFTAGSWTFCPPKSLSGWAVDVCTGRNPGPERWRGIARYPEPWQQAFQGSDPHDEQWSATLIRPVTVPAAQHWEGIGYIAAEFAVLYRRLTDPNTIRRSRRPGRRQGSGEYRLGVTVRQMVDRLSQQSD